MRTHRWPVCSSDDPASAARAEFGVGDRFVVDDHRPLDERLVTELLAAVVGGRRRRLTVDADSGAHEPFGPDQLDAEALQLGGGDVDEVLGDVQLEFDRGRLVLEREVGQPGDERDALDGVVEGLDEQIEVPVLAGDVTRRGVAIPDVVGRAPARRVAVVDQFEADDPGRQGVVGHDQPDPRHDDRLATRPPAVTVEFVAQVLEGDLEAVGVAADHVVGLGQRTERGAQRLQVGAPLLAELGAPSALGEQATGDPVDEAVEHLVRRRRRNRACRPGGIEAASASRVSADRPVVGAVRGVDPPGGDEGTFVGDDGHDAAARHRAPRELTDAGEPLDRVGHVLGVGQLRQPDGDAQRVELHRRDVHRRLAGRLDREPADGAVGDRRIVPAGAHAVAVERPEAVEPRHRGRVEPVPPPHVERAAAPCALGNVGRTVA